MASEFRKNFAKTSKYMIRDIVTKDYLPSTDDFIYSTKDSISRGRDIVRDMRSGDRSLRTMIANNKVIKTIGSMKKTIFSNFKKGVIYKSDYDFDDDMSFEFGDMFYDDGGGEEVSGQDFEDTGRGEADYNKDVAFAANEALAESQEKVAVSLHQDKIVHDSINFNMVVSEIKATNAILMKTAEFNNDMTKSFYEQSTKYYTDSIEILSSINKNTFVNEKEESRNYAQQNYMDLIRGGKFKAAGSDILGRAASAAGPAVSMMWNMMPLLGMMMQQYVQNPMNLVKDAIKMPITKLIGQKNIDMVNNMWGDSRYAVTDYFNRLSVSKNKYARNIGEAFRIPGYMEESELNLKDVENRGIMKWNTDANAALVTVIPTYLRKILSALNQKEELTYDYTRGRFTTLKRLSKSIESEKPKFNYETNDILGLVEKNIEGFGGKINDKEAFKKIFNEIIRGMAHKGYTMEMLAGLTHGDILRITNLKSSDLPEELYHMIKASVVQILRYNKKDKDSPEVSAVFEMTQTMNRYMRDFRTKESEYYKKYIKNARETGVAGLMDGSEDIQYYGDTNGMSKEELKKFLEERSFITGDKLNEKQDERVKIRDERPDSDYIDREAKLKDMVGYMDLSDDDREKFNTALGALSTEMLKNTKLLSFLNSDLGIRVLGKSKSVTDFREKMDFDPIKFAEEFAKNEAAKNEKKQADIRSEISAVHEEIIKKQQEVDKETDKVKKEKLEEELRDIRNKKHEKEIELEQEKANGQLTEMEQKLNDMTDKTSKKYKDLKDKYDKYKGEADKKLRDFGTNIEEKLSDKASSFIDDSVDLYGKDKKSFAKKMLMGVGAGAGILAIGKFFGGKMVDSIRSAGIFAPILLATSLGAVGIYAALKKGVMGKIIGWVSKPFKWLKNKIFGKKGEDEVTDSVADDGEDKPENDKPSTDTAQPTDPIPDVNPPDIDTGVPPVAGSGRKVSKHYTNKDIQEVEEGLKVDKKMISEHGCALAVMAMMYYAITKREVKVEELYQFSSDYITSHGGIHLGFFPDIGKKFNMDIQIVNKNDISLETLTEYVKSNKMAVAALTSIKGSNEGHYLYINGVGAKDSFLINDPESKQMVNIAYSQAFVYASSEWFLIGKIHTIKDKTLSFLSSGKKAVANVMGEYTPKVTDAVKSAASTVHSGIKTSIKTIDDIGRDAFDALARKAGYVKPDDSAQQSEDDAVDKVEEANRKKRKDIDDGESLEKIRPWKRFYKGLVMSHNASSLSIKDTIILTNRNLGALHKDLLEDVSYNLKYIRKILAVHLGDVEGDEKEQHKNFFKKTRLGRFLSGTFNFIAKPFRWIYDVISGKFAERLKKVWRIITFPFRVIKKVYDFIKTPFVWINKKLKEVFGGIRKFLGKMWHFLTDKDGWVRKSLGKLWHGLTDKDGWLRKGIRKVWWHMSDKDGWLRKSMRFIGHSIKVGLFGEKDADGNIVKKGLFRFMWETGGKLMRKTGVFLFGEKDEDGNIIKKGLIPSMWDIGKKVLGGVGSVIKGVKDFLLGDILGLGVQKVYVTGGVLDFVHGVGDADGPPEKKKGLIGKAKDAVGYRAKRIFSSVKGMIKEGPTDDGSIKKSFTERVYNFAGKAAEKTRNAFGAVGDYMAGDEDTRRKFESWKFGMGMKKAVLGGLLKTKEGRSYLMSDVRSALGRGRDAVVGFAEKAGIIDDEETKAKRSEAKATLKPTGEGFAKMTAKVSSSQAVNDIVAILRDGVIKTEISGGKLDMLSVVGSVDMDSYNDHNKRYNRKSKSDKKGKALDFTSTQAKLADKEQDKAVENSDKSAKYLEMLTLALTADEQQGTGSTGQTQTTKKGIGSKVGSTVMTGLKIGTGALFTALGLKTLIGGGAAGVGGGLTGLLTLAKVGGLAGLAIGTGLLVGTAIGAPLGNEISKAIRKRDRRLAEEDRVKSETNKEHSEIINKAIMSDDPEVRKIGLQTAAQDIASGLTKKSRNMEYSKASGHLSGIDKDKLSDIVRHKDIDKLRIDKLRLNYGGSKNRTMSSNFGRMQYMEMITAYSLLRKLRDGRLSKDQAMNVVNQIRNYIVNSDNTKIGNNLGAIFLSTLNEAERAMIVRGEDPYFSERSDAPMDMSKYEYTTTKLADSLSGHYSQVSIVRRDMMAYLKSKGKGLEKKATDKGPKLDLETGDILGVDKHKSTLSQGPISDKYDSVLKQGAYMKSDSTQVKIAEAFGYKVKTAANISKEEKGSGGAIVHNELNQDQVVSELDKLVKIQTILAEALLSTRDERTSVMVNNIRKVADKKIPQAPTGDIQATNKNFIKIINDISKKGNARK